MYGMLLESVQHFVQVCWNKWIFRSLKMALSKIIIYWTFLHINPILQFSNLMQAHCSLSISFPSNISTLIDTFIEKNVKLEYGERVWNRALIASQCKYNVFNTHQQYPDSLIPDLAAALAEITGKQYDYFMVFFGKCFVRFFSNFGWDVFFYILGWNYT